MIREVINKSQFIFEFPYNIIAVVFNPFFFVRKNLYKNIGRYSSKISGRCLDFGCGSKPYINLFENVTEYVGLDIEDERHGFGNDTVDVFYDGKRIPFEDGAFDSIFSSEVYEHIPNISEIIPEINRVLKMGGVYIGNSSICLE